MIRILDSLEQVILNGIRFNKFKFIVTPESFYEKLVEIVQEDPRGKRVLILDTKTFSEPDATQVFRNVGRAGGLLIIKAQESIYNLLLKIVLAYLVDNVLIEDDGYPKGEKSKPKEGFVGIIWLSPEAYLSISEKDRRVIVTLAEKFHYYPDDITKIQPIYKLKKSSEGKKSFMRCFTGRWQHKKCRKSSLAPLRLISAYLQKLSCTGLLSSRD